MAVSFASPVLAHDDDDDDDRGHRHGHGRYKRGEYKEEFWDGRCKVERKVDKKGRYKEERECRGHAGHGPYYGPVYAPAPPPPGVYVQPPSVVLQPPTVVIR